MSVFNSGWYLLYTRPQCEKKIASSLEERGIGHYLPLERKLRIWSDRKKLMEMPLFPSYVFIELTESRDYFMGLETDGVVGYVKFGKAIAKVDAKVVNNLKLVAECGVGLEVISDVLQKGRRMLIAEGAMAGLDCEIVEHKGMRKMLVRVNLLNRSVLVTLPASILIPAKAAIE